MKDFIVFLKSFFFLIILFKSFDLIYLFQTKEYRFDRFLAMIDDEGFLSIFYLRWFRLPAKSLRNFLIFILAVIFSFLVFFLSFWPLIFLLFLFPFFSFVTTGLSTAITAIPVYFYRQSLINKAKALIKNSKTTFIGITGSYGKTTTKEHLYQILSTRFKVAKTEENMNTDVGVALSVIKNLKPDTQFFIVEMGAYKKGEVKTICDFIKPKIGIITAIGNQHLALFGSQENLIAAKKELLNSLPSSGHAYVNAETVGFQKLTNNLRCQIVPFYPSQTKVEELVAFNLGIGKKDIADVVKKFKPLLKRGNSCQGIKNSLVVDDSYNSSVEGFLAMIKLAETSKKQNKIIISRGIIELGKEKQSSYRRILDQLNKTNISLYTTDKLFKTLDKKNQVKLFESDKKLIETVISNVDEKTLTIIEGKFLPYDLSRLCSQ